jgi:hypothetical protein
MPDFHIVELAYIITLISAVEIAFIWALFRNMKGK